MIPEEKARVKIDHMFEDAGWKVVDRDFYSPTLTAAAIREGLLEGNREADCYVSGGGFWGDFWGLCKLFVSLSAIIFKL